MKLSDKERVSNDTIFGGLHLNFISVCVDACFVLYILTHTIQ